MLADSRFTSSLVERNVAELDNVVPSLGNRWGYPHMLEILVLLTMYYM